MSHEVVVAMIVRAQKILLGKRSAARQFYPDVWDLFGGHVEPGEALEQTLVRELQEELDITPSEWTFVETFRQFQGDRVAPHRPVQRQEGDAPTVPRKQDCHAGAEPAGSSIQARSCARMASMLW